MPPQATTDPQQVTDREQLGDALTRLRLTADLSVRDVARRTRLQPSTLGGWFSGSHLPQRTQREAFVAVLHACGVVEADVPAWVDALERARTAPGRRAWATVEPYRGLRSYEQADAAWFFGREELTARLLERVAERASGDGPAVLAVVGPSGAGKSSVLRAGLVPAVRADGVAGVAGPWEADVLTPGPDPLGAWARRTDDRTTNSLVVVDQLEELYVAPAVGDDVRSAFLSAVLRAAQVPADGPRTVVVLGLRADFYGTAMGDPRLAAVLQHAQVVVPPMHEDELRRAITRPAEQAGASVDPELVELLLRDLAPHGSAAAHDPGALPLLSHALAATWRTAPGPRLSVAGYLAVGGIAGAVEQTVEQVYAALSPAEQDLARRVLTRLVNVDESGTVLTRRRVDHGDLPPSTADASLERVLHAFVDARVLTSDEADVQISHEALLTAWDRLQAWLDEDRAALRLQRRVGDAAHAWAQQGHDPALLLRGTQLAAAVELSARDGVLTTVEAEFVARSADAEREQRDGARRRLRRTRRLLAAVAVLALVATASGGLAWRNDVRANHDRQVAVAAGQAALSRQVALEARGLDDRDPALAEQLALVAWRTAPTVEARSALLDQSAGPLVSRVVGGPGPTALALSADGTLAAVGHGDDGSVHLYAVADGSAPRELAVLPGTDGAQVYALRFHGSVLAVGGTTGSVGLWDVADPRRPRLVSTLSPAFDGAVETIAISPDGHTLAAVSIGPDPVRLWDVSDPAHPGPMTAPRGVPASATEQTVAFSPDGTLLAAGGTDGTVYVWDVPSGHPTRLGTPRRFTDGTSTVDVLLLDGHGHLVTGDRGGLVRVVDAATLHVEHTVRQDSTSWVDSLALSPDGTELAVGTSNDTLTRWDTRTWTAISSLPHPDPVTGLAYTPDGRGLLTTSTDGTLRVWPTTVPVTPAPGSSVFSLGFSADGSRLAVADNAAPGVTSLWDVSDPAHPVLASRTATVDGADGTSALSADGRLLAVGSGSGAVQLWDTSDPRRPVRLGGPLAASGALVEGVSLFPDGKTLAVASDDGTVHLWDVSHPAAPVQVASVQGGAQVMGLALSPSGDLMLVGSSDKQAFLVDTRDVHRPRRLAVLGGFASYVQTVAFSRDERLVVAAGADHTTRLWSIADPAHPVPVGAPLTGPAGYVLGASFGAGDRTLAVASNDGKVWEWDLADVAHPVLVATLDAVDGPANAVVFSPDGTHLVGAGSAATVPVWQADPEAFAARVCAQGGTPISREEWAQYVPDTPYAPPCR